MKVPVFYRLLGVMVFFNAQIPLMRIIVQQDALLMSSTVEMIPVFHKLLSVMVMLTAEILQMRKIV